MAEWYDGTVETNGVKLHYTRTGGDKTPIVLAHGLTDNRLAWTKLVRVLEPTYDLIMVDARGMDFRISRKVVMRRRII